MDQATKSPLPPPTRTVPSGCHGGDIPIDASGFIELPDEIAEQLNLGQIAPLDGEPNTSGYKILGDALAAEQAKRGMEDRIEEGGKERWMVGAPRVVTRVGLEGTMRVGG